MSVINQMLRDLDARDASSQERADLPKRLRPLPPARGDRFKSWQMLALGLGVGMLVAGIAVSLFFSSQVPEAIPPVQPAPPAPRPPPTQPPPPEQPALPAQPSSPSPSADVLPALPPVVVVAPVPEAATASAPKETAEIKLATKLATPKPAPAAKSPEVAKTPVAGEPAKPLSASKETKATTPPKPSAAAAEPAPDAQIDKRSAGGQAREMAEAEYRKAMQAVKRNEGAAAMPVLQRTLELDPLHAKARQALLSVLVSGKQWPDAQRVAQAGLALEPNQTGWASILARLQFEQGDAPAALETLSRHAAHATSDADYQGLFAYLLQKQQRFAEAAQHFQMALALRPQEGRWWFGLGLALESGGRTGEARDAYAKAREVGNLPHDMAATVEQKLR